MATAHHSPAIAARDAGEPIGKTHERSEAELFSDIQRSARAVCGRLAASFSVAVEMDVPQARDNTLCPLTSKWQRRPVAHRSETRREQNVRSACVACAKWKTVSRTGCE